MGRVLLHIVHSVFSLSIVTVIRVYFEVKLKLEEGRRRIRYRRRTLLRSNRRKGRNLAGVHGLLYLRNSLFRDWKHGSFQLLNSLSTSLPLFTTNESLSACTLVSLGPNKAILL